MVGILVMPSAPLYTSTSNILVNKTSEDVENVTVFTTTGSVDLNTTHAASTFLFGFGIAIGIIALATAIVAVVIFLIRKSKLDKLRHHLMPLYSFDPTEEGEDWETELIEEGLDHRQHWRGKHPGRDPVPKLAFDGGL
ncbi:uncharacterized protein LOC143226309 [Tachypleus tridentatus]|uniref:uncharacterized protein LOC143226309 n=1 Tax=Tachypleus tridentatus TaxID=6853 RepID=UPI003FD5088D